MKIRDRIKDFRRVKASELLPDERNWRRHPGYQREALRGVLQEIGFADALLVRETPEGLVLVDGHLRADLTPDMEVPVLVLDVTEMEAAKLLVTLDPLAAMAQADGNALTALLGEVSFDSQAVNDMLEALANGERKPMPDLAMPPQEYVERYEIVVECDGEEAQQSLFERLKEEGFRCRVLRL